MYIILELEELIGGKLKLENHKDWDATNLKRELDITQGGLRKAGYPASQARKLRKEAEKFYERQTKLKCLG